MKRCRSGVHRSITSHARNALLEDSVPSRQIPTNSVFGTAFERLLPSARGHCRPRPASLHCACPHALSACYRHHARSQRAVVCHSAVRVTGDDTRCFVLRIPLSRPKTVRSAFLVNLCTRPTHTCAHPYPTVSASGGAAAAVIGGPRSAHGRARARGAQTHAQVQAVRTVVAATGGAHASCRVAAMDSAPRAEPRNIRAGTRDGAGSPLPHLHRMTLQLPTVSVVTAAGGLLSVYNCRSLPAAATRRRCGCSGTVARYVATFIYIPRSCNTVAKYT